MIFIQVTMHQTKPKEHVQTISSWVKIILWVMERRALDSDSASRSCSTAADTSSFADWFEKEKEKEKNRNLNIICKRIRKECRTAGQAGQIFPHCSEFSILWKVRNKGQKRTVQADLTSTSDRRAVISSSLPSLVCLAALRAAWNKKLAWVHDWCKQL